MHTVAETNPQPAHPEYASVAGDLSSVISWDVGGVVLDQTVESPEGVAAHKATLELRNELAMEGSAESRNIAQLLSAAPVETVANIDGKQFYLSGVISIANRKHCVGYVKQEDGRVAPRLFYRSVSEGDWRVAPFTDPVENEGGPQAWYLSKGDKYEGGYVRETRLVDPLRDELNYSESVSTTVWEPKSANWLYERFTNENLGTRGEENYWKTADYTRVKGMPNEAFRFRPGTGFETEKGELPARDQLAQLELPEPLMPNFSKVHNTGVLMHPTLGRVNQVAFRANRGSLVWHFCYDAHGRVWPAGLTGVYDPPNSYGTSEEITFTGVFDNKPLEYRSQIAGLVEGVDYQPVNNQYADITPLLSNLPIVKAFKQQFGIGMSGQPAYAGATR